LIQVEDNWTIQLNPGDYDITGTLTMDGKSNVTIDGSNGGAILSFVNQSDGGEGILISNSANHGKGSGHRRYGWRRIKGDWNQRHID
jgi:hypothetical protein